VDNDETETVVRHYETYREEDRFSTGLGELELLRTQEILLRHLPPAPARLLDVGGATGAHAQWLVAEGYEVHIVDLSPRHVEKALTDLGPHGVTAEVGDARELTASSQSYESVLLLGPMYHLTSRSDRIKCLQEALRLLRTDGIVAVAAISRFASLCDGLARGCFFDPKFRKIVERDLAEGQHRNSENVPHWFTTAYFHEPQELHSEIEEAGMQVRTLVGVEGPAGCMKHLVERWDTPGQGGHPLCRQSGRERAVNHWDEWSSPRHRRTGPGCRASYACWVSSMTFPSKSV
jgi:SAM-dependent methyltransferase